MNRKNIFLLLCIFFTDALPALAQGGKTLLELPRVGETIDRNERDYFGVFPSIMNFERAIFTRDTAGVYTAHVWTRRSGGAYELRTLTFHRQTFLQFVERLVNFEGLQNGTYKMGHRALTGFLADSSDRSGSTVMTIGQERNQVSLFPERLPFADVSEEAEGDTRIQVGFGYGYSTYSLAFEALNSVMQQMEAKYESQGFQLPHRRISVDIRGMPWWYLSFRYGRSLVLDLNAGSASTERAAFRGASASLIYVMHPSYLKGVRPFAGVGLGSFNLSLDQVIHYNVRVSPANAKGEYTVLSHIRFSGGETESAILLTAGLEVGTEAPYSGFGVSCFASYLFTSEFAVSTNVGPSPRIDMSSPMIGLRGMIYF